ncbi:MAG: hypothetical protein KKH73_00865, partial [Actinobacteria bacterium]|nr:hypothetical protein [Actinomycetota bacterium]
FFFFIFCFFEAISPAAERGPRASAYLPPVLHLEKLFYNKYRPIRFPRGETSNPRGRSTEEPRRSHV